MKGLKLDFSDEGIRLVPFKVVSGKSSISQNALLNIAQTAGSDKAYPDKGTRMLMVAARNGLPTPNRAQHEANFAAVDTLFFSRASDPEDTPDSLAMCRLALSAFELQRITLDAQFVFIDGVVEGEITPIVTVLQ